MTTAGKKVDTPRDGRVAYGAYLKLAETINGLEPGQSYVIEVFGEEEAARRVISMRISLNAQIGKILFLTKDQRLQVRQEKIRDGAKRYLRTDIYISILPRAIEGRVV